MTREVELHVPGQFDPKGACSVKPLIPQVLKTGRI